MSSVFTWPNAKRFAVSMTFDDARPTQADVGLPILDAHGAKATFYVTPQAVEQRLDAWHGAVANGHEIGNHTWTHPCSGNFAFSRQKALEDWSLDTMAADLDRATAVIADTFGIQATTFAYPCGQSFVGRGASRKSYTPLIAERFVAGRGFRNEYLNDPMFCDLAMVGSVAFDALSIDELRVLMNDAAATGAWLILSGHDVGDTPGRQTVPIDTLEWLSAQAADVSCEAWIDTVAAVAGHIAKARLDK